MKIRSVTSVKGYLLGLLMPALLATLPLAANNVRIEGMVKVTEVSGNVATLEINLTWDHSWRDSYNWDAVWVFLKYNKDGMWKHADLAETGHQLTGAYSYTTGKTNGQVKGLFIRRSGRGGGQSAVVCRLKWPLPAGVTTESFDRPDVFLLAQGIEMVYIPYGAYRLGDGASEKSFKDGENHPYVIGSEESCSLSADGNTTVSLAADYPKGFRGFYVMKYELSQEQYVSFLNTLTRSQQNELIPGVVDKTRRQYVFGSGTEPADRNGIVVEENVPDKPLVFDNNLTNDGDFKQENDGLNVACNYVCVRDLVAYSAWAGLRPMSELEYEKACRKPYPMNVTANEYAWNSAADLVQAATLQGEGTPDEYPSVGNVNINNGIAGPLRCGAFAAASGSTPNQVKAGATYPGVMEMSGNLRELCASVEANGVLTGEKHGNGEYDLALWGSTPAHFGLRGGGFDSPQARASVSDRADMAAITDVANRSASAKSIGFRCVHTMEESATAVNAGEILPQTATVCPEMTTIKINNVTEASVNGSSDIRVTYVWYMDGSKIKGATGAELTHTLPANTTTASVTYTFEREAVVPEGSKRTTAVSVTVLPKPQFTINPDTVAMRPSDPVGTQTVTATAAVSGPGVSLTYEWKYGETILSTEATYQPDPKSFSAEEGIFDIICTATLNGCTQTATQTLKVTVSAPIWVSCGDDFTDTRPEGNNEVYPTVQIGEQCWMAKNMNVGTRVEGTNYDTHTTAEIQKICYSDNESNCTTYGGLYSWEETVYGEKTNGYKYSETHPSLIQGICPDGWHVPSDDEWKTLELSLNMDASVVGNTGWRGTDQGCQLKSTDYWSSHSNSGTNSSKMNMRPGGYRYYTGGTFYVLGDNGWWWSSTASDDSSDAWGRDLSYTEARVDRWTYAKSFGFSVRCVRNTQRDELVLNPGEIALPDGAATTLCADGGSVTINNTTAATVSVGDAPAYKWYVDNAEITGATGAELTHTLPANTTTASVTYTFEREAVVPEGSVRTAALSVTVLPLPQFTINPDTVAMSTSDASGSTVTATAGVSGTGVGLTYVWTYNGTNLSTGATYTPKPGDFSADGGEFEVVCTATLNGCTQTATQTLKVTVSAPASSCGDDFTDTRPEGNNEVYPTVQIGEQCWMAKNMNVGTRVDGSTYNTHTTAEIQKICYGDNESNCTTYGGLYSWEETVYGEKTNDYKYSETHPSLIQGICPDGWHVPSDAEWQTLEVSLGMDASTANTTGWRGTDQGRQLKSTDLWTFYNNSTTGTNTSKMNMRSGGYRGYIDGSFGNLGTYGYWWSSTANDGSRAWRWVLRYSEARVYRDNDLKSYGYSVRCVRN